MKKIISLLDEHIEGTLLIIKRLPIEKVVFLLQDTMKETMNNISSFFKEWYPKVNLEFVYLDFSSATDIENQLLKFNKSDFYINLSEGDRLTTLLLCTISIKNEYKCLYADTRLEEIKLINDFSNITAQNDSTNLSVEEIIESSGAEIEQDSTSNNKDHLVQNFTKYILDNRGEWTIFKRLLAQKNLINYKSDIYPRLIVTLKEITEYEKVSFINIISKLKSLQVLDYFVNQSNEMVINFRNDYFRSLLLKSGTWLEVLTQTIVEEIEGISSVLSSVVFLWNDKNKIIRNELDVVASCYSKLVCISCKDTSNYDEKALNELEVYSQRLAGDSTIKILVSTQIPVKQVVLDRATEMGIHIVLYRDNIIEFRTQLTKVILMGNNF